MSPTRAHLSIGEVLSLLQDEFPDVTISKIRFLESQGLLDPERTPSGYRKFYEEDIARLRWILVQQRENFLPLRVIKQRLELSAAAGLVVPADDAPAPGGGGTRSGDRSDRTAGGSGAGDTGGAAPLAGRSDLDAPVPPRTAPMPGWRVRVEQAAAEAAAGPRMGREVGDTIATAADPIDPPQTPGARGSEGEPPAGGPSGSVTGSSADAQPDAGGPAAAAAQAAALRPVAAEPAAVPTSVTGASRAGRTEPAGGASTVGSPLDPGPTGVSLTREELAAWAGLDAPQLAELERFGLLQGRQVGSDVYFDGDALVVARGAAGFLRYGIEARHLRMYKVAAEREAGFYEQVILPLLKQRNPEGRRRAMEILADLARLGDGLHAALLRAALADYSGT